MYANSGGCSVYLRTGRGRNAFRQLAANDLRRHATLLGVDMMCSEGICIELRGNTTFSLIALLWWIFVVYKDVLLGKQIGDGFLFPHRVLDSHQVFRILTKKINIMVQLAVGRAHEKKPCKLILAIFISYFLFCLIVKNRQDLFKLSTMGLCKFSF